MFQGWAVTPYIVMFNEKDLCEVWNEIYFCEIIMNYELLMHILQSSQDSDPTLQNQSILVDSRFRDGYSQHSRINVTYKPSI